MQVGALDILQTILQWVVAPIAAIVLYMYRQMQGQQIDIEVLKSETATNKQSHDREMKEIRDTTERIFQKLNSIEEALRK